ncbi:MAG: hypothetical protein ACI9SC_000425 [Gammaproteobacteria bacterium]|jgi:hypothetical protein
MKFSTRETADSANGIACLAIVKMLIEIMQKKGILSEEVIEIILNCAAVEVDESDDFDRMIEAKVIIENLLLSKEIFAPTGPRDLF